MGDRDCEGRMATKLPPLSVAFLQGAGNTQNITSRTYRVAGLVRQETEESRQDRLVCLGGSKREEAREGAACSTRCWITLKNEYELGYKCRSVGGRLQDSMPEGG